MPEIVLHNYPNSPFSEKVRKIFALKKVAWRSVEQPVIMPKPKLVPLTGGYRRIPVMQIGADIYCDTGIIVRKLEELYPQPTIYPTGSEGICHMINLWADRHMFFTSTSVIFEKLAPLVPKEFIEDRTKMMPGRDFSDLPKASYDARNQLRAFLDMIDRQLRDGRHFLLGGAFSLADAACYHTVWFMRSEPGSFALAQRNPNLMSWFERVESMGVGNSTPMSQDEALALAKDSRPATTPSAEPDDPNQLQVGDRVEVMADDYGFDPIAGTVVVSSLYEIAIEREDPSLSRLVNHFPKVGFRIRKL